MTIHIRRGEAVKATPVVLPNSMWAVEVEGPTQEGHGDYRDIDLDEGRITVTEVESRDEANDLARSLFTFPVRHGDAFYEASGYMEIHTERFTVAHAVIGVIFRKFVSEGRITYRRMDNDRDNCEYIKNVLQRDTPFVDERYRQLLVRRRHGEGYSYYPLYLLFDSAEAREYAAASSSKGFSRPSEGWVESKRRECLQAIL